MSVMSPECEPYANGEGWWHVPGCPHVDWEGDDLRVTRFVPVDEGEDDW